jgi:tRNA modification GTPase
VRFADPISGEPLDDGLVLWFPAPASVTGEDVAELHLHGSRAVIAGIVAALHGQGLRLAEPGEFTRRAFLAGKLDLTQAEAVADLVAAETEAQRRQALRQLAGELGGLYRGWGERLVRTLAHLEAAIDFPDEDLPPEIEGEIDREIALLSAEIVRHLTDGHRGERLRDGIMVAILGPPNAGKSSLLNRIARREAAIVSPVAGTTRDIVEVAIDLGGYPIVLADTAGLRDSADAVEREGLRRALRRAEEADIRLFVFDARDPAGAARAAAWPPAGTILVANKIDLVGRGRDGLPLDAVPVSALTGDGVDRLLSTLAAEAAAGYRDAAPALTRARHRAALEAAAAALERSLAAPLAELRAEDLRLAWRSLGRITGRVDVEDLLDVIFADFCIGK